MMGVVPITEIMIPTLDAPLTYLEQYAPEWVLEVLALCDLLD